MPPSPEITKRTRAKWARIFNEHQASGLSAAEFCRQHKVCPKYFSLRRKNMMAGNQLATKVPSVFAKVQVSHAPEEPAGGAMQLHFGNSRLTMSAVSVDWVAQLLKALEHS